MSARETLRTEITDGVFVITLSRAAEYNTITPQLRDELAAAIDEGDADHRAHAILLRAEGPAFCAGYGLDWSTAAQAAEIGSAKGGSVDAAEQRRAAGCGIRSRTTA
jgi:enoyl-CoA hydratase